MGYLANSLCKNHWLLFRASSPKFWENEIPSAGISFSQGSPPEVETLAEIAKKNFALFFIEQAP